MSEKKKTKEKTNKTKQKIIEVTEKLFSERGFDNTSIDDIAKAADVTKSLFYYYFETKNDILYTLMKLKIEEAVKEVAERRKSSGCYETKDELYEKCIDFIKRNENIFKIALFEFLKTNKGINIITELPKVVFSEVENIFVFSEREQLQLTLLVIKMTTYYVLRKSLCAQFNVEETELEKMYMESIWGGLWDEVKNKKFFDYFNLFSFFI